ncbi:MAG: ABC transporter substrate-binding protein, partial [Candidatus Thorarchaeota archaeon]
MESNRRLIALSIIFFVMMIGVGNTPLNIFEVPTTSSLSNTNGSTIIIGTTNSVENTLDIAKAYDIFGWTMISCLSSGLVEILPGSIAANEDIVPALAESWSVLANGTIWDFNLREGVIFENGNPFNASVVKYTFDRNCNLEGDGLLELDGPQLNIGYDDIIDNVTILDTYEVRFYLKIPFAPFLKLLANPPSYIVDPANAPKDEIVTYSEGDPRGSHPCGLGPFLLESWSRIGGSDIEIRLAANTDYWDNSSGEPKANEIIVKFYSSDTALATAKTAGEIDIAYRYLSSSQIESFMTMEDMNVYSEPRPQIQYLCFNQDIYPYNETLIRQGIGAALDRSDVCDTVFNNHAIPLESIVPNNLEYHLPSFEIYGAGNYTFTRTCLETFGYNEENKLDLSLYFEISGHYPQSPEQALMYEMQLESSGVIDVTVTGLDWPSYRMARNDGTMPVFIYGWYDDYSDADNFAFLPFTYWLNLGYNTTYPQGGIDQYNLWLEGRTNITDEGRRTAYYELQELQAVECSVIPIWQGKDFVVADL